MKCRIPEYRAENLKALEEQRNDKIAEMEALVSAAKGETRAMTDDESAKFTALEKEIAAIDDTIKKEETLRALDISKGAAKNQKQKSEEKTEAEERAFANYIRGIREERADVNFNTTENGAVIPSSIANKIIEKVVEICPIYQLATRYNVGGALSIPYYDEESQSIEMDYADEFVELTSTAGKFTSISLNGFLAGVLTKVSKSLVNNSQFAIVPFVVNAMARNISRWIEKELLNGTAGKITGLSTVTQEVAAAGATALKSDELIDLQEAIPDVYQANAIWIMHKSTRTAIRKFKDSDGNYILNKDATARWGYTLFGKDVYTSANMPKAEAGETAIYYGDMSGLAVKISEDVSIEVAREKYLTQHAIGVVGWVELDSKVENAQKIAKLVMGA
jgi:HK97 family phage major capsid protein